jgi:hypothetical protein
MLYFGESPRPSQSREEIGETKSCEEMRRNVVTKYTPCFLKV